MESQPAPIPLLSRLEREWMLQTAYVLLEQRQPESAVVLLQVLHHFEPENPEILDCLALAELSAGFPERAEPLARAMLMRESTPRKRRAAALMLARCLYGRGEVEGARQILATTIFQPTE